MRTIFALALAVLAVGCGPNEKTGNDALRTESDVVDVRVSEAAPNLSQATEAEALVGFDSAGRESRLLVHFPGLLRLWDEAVIVSSIAEVLFNLNCTEVAANPESIELVPMSRPWTPFATWASPYGILPGKDWATPGGDVDSLATPVTPAVRPHPSVSGTFELQFDLTGIVKAMILEGKKNYGFQIRIRKSSYNYDDKMHFRTGNLETEALRPTSVLTYSTREGISQ